MLVLSCLLLATSALGAEYAPYTSQNVPERSAYPIDYHYNMQQQIKPGSRFTYNFEQTRSNQPSQVESRDEEIGRYMYRNPQTTTTTTEPSTSRDELLVQVPEVNVEPKAPVPPMNLPMTRQPDNYHYQTWNNGPVGNRPPPPAPPAPKWQELDLLPLPHSYQARAVTTQVPVQWSDPSRTQPFLNRASEEVAPREPSIPQWVERAADVHPKEQQVQNRPPPPSPQNRGSHKFSWDEVATPTTISPGPATQPMGPPPPPPKLSPWYGDNFGK